MISGLECGSCSRTSAYRIDDVLTEARGRELVAIAALADGWIVYRSTRAWHCPACVERSQDSIALREALRARTRALSSWTVTK